MHVFLAGSTGVLGRRIVPLLVEGGHRVTALTRDPAKVGELAGLGAEPVIADALDRPAVVAAVAAAAPDVVMNQLTDLRGGVGPANAEIRIQASAALAEGARVAGVRRIVAQSIAWAYGAGSEPAGEAEPLDVGAPGRRGGTVRAVQALEEATAGAPGWVVLRYGMLYGPGTWFAADGARGAEARAGKLAADADVTSFVHVDDAARAAVAALSWPTGPVNVCDDEPAPGTDWVPVFSRAAGGPAPTPAAGSERSAWARGADNTWLRSGLRFELHYPSWRDGFGKPGA